MPEYKYPLSNEWKAARERLAQLEAVWDPWTIRNFEKLGVTEGWHCLEVAGGGGSVAEWLCRQAGKSGHVVATDLQPRFLEAIDASNLEVWRHDILAEPLPEEQFDLVHARAVLTFLPRPAETITKMAAALKPGGWLLLEEPDYVSAIPDPSMAPAAAALSKKGWDALLHQLQSRGYDTGFGRHLYHDVAVNGLGDLQAEGFVAHADWWHPGGKILENYFRADPGSCARSGTSYGGGLGRLSSPAGEPRIPMVRAWKNLLRNRTPRHATAVPLCD